MTARERATPQLSMYAESLAIQTLRVTGTLVATLDIWIGTRRFSRCTRSGCWLRQRSACNQPMLPLCSRRARQRGGSHTCCRGFFPSLRRAAPAKRSKNRKKLKPLPVVTLEQFRKNPVLQSGPWRWVETRRLQWQTNHSLYSLTRAEFKFEAGC